VFVVTIIFVIYAAFSCIRYAGFGSSGYDLGIFTQAVWHYSRFEAPISTIRELPNILGDHFHPIVIALAPLFWIWPSPYMLLLAQAALIAISIIPIWLFVRRRLDAAPSYLLVSSYALFWGVVNAVAFDFHEVAFAVPLIATAIWLIDIKRWTPFYWTIAGLLLVKEDQAILVVFFGLYLLLKKYWRPALVCVLSGIVWFLLTTKVLIPYFAGAPFAHWSYTQLGPDAMSALWTAITHPLTVVALLTTPVAKLVTAWQLFSPFLLLSFLSPLVILTIPLILERFLSTNSHYWLQVFHYSATISPIIALSAADGLSRLAKHLQSRHKRLLVLTATIVILLLNVWGLATTEFRYFAKPEFYNLADNQRLGQQALDHVPADASVTAQDGLLPRLANRRSIFVLRPNAPLTDYVVASDRVSTGLANISEVQVLLNKYVEIGYEPVFEQDGWLVLRRPPQ